VSYVAIGRTPSGENIVLKINFPDPASALEGVALEHWAGHGAVRLLAEDVDDRAMLLERCLPGHSLWDEPEVEATASIERVISRLWSNPASELRLETLEHAAARWSIELNAAFSKAHEPFETSLLNEALHFMTTARPPSETDVVLHQDLHGGNVVRRGGEWVAIDPKPLRGEREFDLASFIRDRRDDLWAHPDPESIVRTRLDVLSDRLGLDRGRARGWALSHALAWGYDSSGEFYPEQVQAARLIARC
jgi:streptomycin 6-kinase